METKRYKFQDIVNGKEGLLKGPFGSDLKKSLYVPKAEDTYKVYLQENILKTDKSKGKHYISEEYFNNKMRRYKLSDGDFIVTCDGTLGEIYQINDIEEKGIISSSLLRITLNNELVDDDFFFYFWTSRMKYPLIASHDNSVLKHLPGVKAIREFEFDLPELKTQKKVGKLLKDIDLKIDLNNSINKELEAIAKTLYDYWFVQFDFPDIKDKPYKSSGGKMVYSAELKRELPGGWESEELSEQINILNGYAFKSKDYVKNGIFVLRTKNFNNNHVVEFKSDDVYLPVNYLDTYKTYICEPFDYHLVMVGASVGKRGLIYSHHLPALRNQNMWCFRAKRESEVGHAFIKQLLDDLIKGHVQSATGSARDFLTKKNFKAIQMLVPPKNILEAFEKQAFPLMELQAIKSKENKKLTELRDWLLPMLMNGQVKVK